MELARWAVAICDFTFVSFLTQAKFDVGFQMFLLKSIKAYLCVNQKQ